MAAQLTLLPGIETRSLRLRWRLKRAYLKVRQPRLSLGRDVQIARRATIAIGTGASERITIGDGCEIHQGAILATYRGWIEIGRRCSVNPYSILYGHGGLRIGNGVRIAAHCVIIPANHRFEDRERPIAEQGEERRGITIEDDVWIGAHVTVLDGCTIGRGSVVAAGSVVTRDVPPGTIVAGSPARVIRGRGEGGRQPVQAGGAGSAAHHA